MLGLLVLAVLGCSAPSTAVDGWRYAETVDPMTDKVTRVVVRPADAGRDRFGFRCTDGRAPEVIVAAEDATPDTREGSVLVRVDGAMPELWPAKSSGRVLTLTLDSVSRGQLGRAGKVAVQYATLTGPDHVSVFALAGTEEAYARCVGGDS